MQYYTVDNIVDHFRNSPKYQTRNVVVPTTVKRPEKYISIVTTCMNRLRDLQYTLPRNLEDTKDYKNLEFVLLDYNSEDGLDDWIRAFMMPYIESGRLVYYRTEEPKHFHPNHSRNVSFRLARGEVVANVDSDNYMHRGYAARINQCISVAPEKVLVVPDNFLEPGTRRLRLKGRFALYKKDIERLRGFDEDLDEGFGNDDLNFVFRAMMDNFLISRFEHHYTNDRIETTNKDRVKYVVNKDYVGGRDHNYEITQRKIWRGMIDVNRGKEWGKCRLVKNFTEVVEV